MKDSRSSTASSLHFVQIVLSKQYHVFWVVLSVVLFMTSCFFAYRYWKVSSDVRMIDSYIACAGNPGSVLLERYPAICITSDGRRFIQPLGTDDAENTPDTQQNTTPGTSACIYKGKTYTDGESFKDSCNSCSCSAGQIACTLMACEQ